jgi:hypothetical protein
MDIIDALRGRRFVTRSGNVAWVSRIGDGALRATYRDEPTPEDMDEFEAFVQSIAGAVSITRSVGRAAEAANYEIWRRQKRR